MQRYSSRSVSGNPCPTGSPGLPALLVATLAVLSAPAPSAAQTERPAAAGDVLGHETSQQADFELDVVASGFRVPYALAFLPDGRLLVSDRPAATLSLVDPGTGETWPVSGLPSVHAPGGEGGLMDVVLHPDHGTNGWIYFSYASAEPEGVVQAVSRARLDGTRLVDLQRLLTTDPPVPDNQAHLGSRLVLDGGYLFVTMGERYDLRDQAQDPSDHHGTVLRVHDDGRVPRDNPFANGGGAPEVWSYGHRNPQGMAVHPASGDLWLNEHGPQGGDEINVVRPGANYGWPTVTYGKEYDSEGGGYIGQGLTEMAGMEDPLYVYTPSIGPSDMLFYTGSAYPRWQGDVFVGGLALRHLNRLEVVDGRVIHEERLLGDRGWRVRSVEQGPDGLIYVGVDGGMIVRLRPVPGPATAPSASPAPAPAANAAPGPPPSCTDAEGFDRLDFWVGRWTVEVQGREVGTNRIEKVLGGCAVEEHWRDAGGGEGRGLFYYLPAVDEWHQVWVTPQATSPGGVKQKRLVQTFDDGGVRFQGVIVRPGGTRFLDRTTLTPLDGGRVRQHIEVSMDGGATWRTTFDAEYVPAASDAGAPGGTR